MNRRALKFKCSALGPRGWRYAGTVLAAVLFLTGASPCAAEPADPGRLFFTPAQRAQLEAARARHASPAGPRNPATPDEGTPPLRYDGVLIRSDGKTTRWIDGEPQSGGSAVPGLKPGQIRADGKVYEPYQVLRPTPPGPAAPKAEEPAP